MEDLIKTIETFLAFSDDKLAALAQKNQELREQVRGQEGEDA